MENARASRTRSAWRRYQPDERAPFKVHTEKWGWLPEKRARLPENVVPIRGEGFALKVKIVVLRRDARIADQHGGSASRRQGQDTHSRAVRVDGEQRALFQFGGHLPQGADDLFADHVRADILGADLHHARLLAVGRGEDALKSRSWVTTT